jgi:hypothetical protein
VGRWNAAASSTAKHQHDLSGMWPGLGGKSQDASAVCRMRFYRECRSCRRDQHSKGGIHPVRLSSELRSKRSAAGTHRKGGVAALVGISFLQGGEDVNPETSRQSTPKSDSPSSLPASPECPAWPDRCAAPAPARRCRRSAYPPSQDWQTRTAQRSQS